MATLLYESDTTDLRGATEFITRLLNFAVTAHLHHLSTDSYAKHMALDSLYSELPGLVDSLTEAFMGCTGQKLQPLGDPLTDVQNIYEYVEVARTKMGRESHIQNEVDNICNLIASTLYKLKQLS